MTKRKPMDIHPKTASAGLSGSLTVVLVWLAGLAGLDVPEEVAAAFASILAFGGAYLTEGP